MATISIPTSIQTESPTTYQVQFGAVLHPAHAVTCIPDGASVVGIQKEAAENFKWGR